MDYFFKREQRKARKMIPMAYYVTSRCLTSTRPDEEVTFSLFIGLLWPQYSCSERMSYINLPKQPRPCSCCLSKDPWKFSCIFKFRCGIFLMNTYLRLGIGLRNFWKSSNDWFQLDKAVVERNYFFSFRCFRLTKTWSCFIMSVLI